jgi:hypothetical protein
MNIGRRYFRIPSVALAAIIGMLSVAGEASACSMKAAKKAASACCTGNSQSACCCDADKVESKFQSSELTLVRTLPEAGAIAPASSCECRPGNPTEPASKPESGTSRHQTDQDRVRSASLISEIRPAIIFVRLALPTERPPATPLYLRMSRLLI